MHARTFLYTGCYTNQSRVGIHVFDAGSGPLAAVGEFSGVENPSFLAPHPNGRVLYAVSEASSGNGDGGGVFALQIEPSNGALTPLQDVPSGGDAPCHLSVDAKGEYLCVANYVSGSVAGYRLEADGRIGEMAFNRHHEGAGPSHRQEGPHAHCAVPHPHRPGVVVADLGIDQLIYYTVDGVAEDELQMAPGSGPRHLAWHPSLPVCFVVGELDNTITVVNFDPHTGRLSAMATLSTLPPGFDHPSLAAEVRVNRAGTRVYVSNRGHDSIATYAFSDGDLELLAHVPSGGRGPRNFALHPAGDTLVVANQDNNSINRFAIDPDTGIPTRLDESYQVAEPVCVTFVETGS